MRNFRLLIIILVAGILTFPVGLTFATPLEGYIYDQSTGNPVPDATVEVTGYTNLQPITIKSIPGSHQFDVTDLAGYFSIKVEHEGEYQLSISHLGYLPARITMITGDEPSRTNLYPEVIELAKAVVTLGRTDPVRIPGAKTTLDRKLVELSYGTQDVPMLISETVNATAFSWSGSDVGASSINIRGFSSDRIAATVNGVPINDPEDHEQYWQDSPDFLSNTYNIQVERGVSSFLNGPTGVGGGLNLVTSDAVSKRELGITYQGGSYNTQRRTFFYRSGIVNDKYNFTGRFSKVTTDGYRDHTSADMWSYFLAAARFDPNMVTRLQVYGGQEEMDAYWWGVSESMLETHRRANYSAWYKDYHEELFWYESVDYDGERDFFQQPHYMLHNQWRLSPRLVMNQSLFWILGNGFYEEYKPGRDYWEYNLSSDPDDDRETDLIRRKNVDKNQYGWLPRINWQTNHYTSMELGLELRNYTGEHWGNVMWAEDLPDEVSPQHEWYRWTGEKSYLGGFFNLDHQLNHALSFNAGLQVRNINYQVEQKVIGAFSGYEYDLDWTFINPRLGLNYQFDRDTRLYASFAGAGREPVDDMIFDADNPYDIPKVSKFNQPEIDPEYMWDIEMGIQRRFGLLEMGVNLYGMFFTDEIIKTGFSSDLDEEVYINAPATRHMGVELDAKWEQALPGLTLSGNLSYGQAILGDFEIDHVAGLDDNWEPIIETVNLDGNRIARFPDLVANLRATYSTSILTASLRIQHVGKQYMDNREDEEATLDPYSVLDGTLLFRLLGWNSNTVDLELRGMNLLDTEYEPFGIVDVEDGTPYYVPAAGRRYLLGLTIRM